MSVGDLIALLRGGVFQILLMSIPLLVSALAVGLLIAILQAATSIQEQTLTFVPKIIIILLMLALLGGWMFTSLGDFTRGLFMRIPEMAG
ncbi:MAG: flagellar biosynthesis protein FliQ [Treponema sp.]|nr:flagellar biosynthesis protein FliQ [Treponema sp.]